jgi:hypothetical protein
MLNPLKVLSMKKTVKAARQIIVIEQGGTIWWGQD